MRNLYAVRYYSNQQDIFKNVFSREVNAATEKEACKIAKETFWDYVGLYDCELIDEGI